MPHSFPNIGNAAEFVGQTPWSARDALVPLSARRIKALHATMADEGVGRGRGRPPYNLRRCSAMGKLCGINREGAQRAPAPSRGLLPLLAGADQLFDVYQFGRVIARVACVAVFVLLIVPNCFAQRADRAIANRIGLHEAA